MAQAIQRHAERILSIDGVVGLDQSRAPDGTDVIRVHVTSESVRRDVPQELDGYPVTTLVTGTPEAY
ncbi:hypothetical protein [Actinomadura latina]|uniref:Uncharacterized protein n=1 Tax=Actinomadura latina TaxID=163603 RepID=A0A846Z2J1_9ACTN|nr:hypothetical protein [Actinomadura latina]NKZ07149.1 hypothetical protein [Actinomadura latina]